LVDEVEDEDEDEVEEEEEVAEGRRRRARFRSCLSRELLRDGYDEVGDVGIVHRESAGLRIHTCAA
jgi:hypothetical protein